MIARSIFRFVLVAVVAIAITVMLTPQPTRAIGLQLCPWELTVNMPPATGVYKWQLFAELFQQDTSLPHSRWRVIDRGEATLEQCLLCTRLLATGQIVAGPISSLVAIVEFPIRPGPGQHLYFQPGLRIAWPVGTPGCQNLGWVRAYPLR